MEVRYNEHAFFFRPEEASVWHGTFVLDEGQRNLLRQLLDSEDEAWGLDRNGERLEEHQLFSRSPWSVVLPSGAVLKLLCRFIDPNDGQVSFDTPDWYPGDQWRFMRLRAQ